MTHLNALSDSSQIHVLGSLSAGIYGCSDVRVLYVQAGVVYLYPVAQLQRCAMSSVSNSVYTV